MPREAAMLAFLLRRLVWLALTLWVVVSVAFVLMRAVPGGPFDGERSLDPLVEQSLRARYHLDWPLWRQYLHYVGPLSLDEGRARWLGGDGSRVASGLFAGDLGPSLEYPDFGVADVIAQSLPISAALGLVALLGALALGVPAGIAAALRRGSALDVALRLAATAGIALPNFVIASALVIGLGFWAELLPVAGWGRVEHLVLPGLALGAPTAAYVARLTRTGLLEVLGADFVRAARAKGMPARIVVLRHALRAGLLPLVSYLGPATAGILTGSLVIETMFAIPGTGTHFVNSALNRDYTLAMGVTILYTLFVFVLNTLVDVAYALLDPRIELRP
jgi:oligopeptide transport system permease protein